MDDMALEKKDLPELIQASAQDKTEQNTMGVFWMMYQATGLVPNWWSPARDVALRKLAANCDHLISAIYSMASKLAAVPFRVEPRDPTVASHRKQAEWYQSVLEEQSEWYAGWIDLCTKTYTERWENDNGFFWEIIGDGPASRPIRGPALGLAVLDSGSCRRTGNPEYPVVYTNKKGEVYKYHYTRVAFSAELPSARAEMNGIGTCWVSRCLGIAQNMVDIVTYKQEKLGSRPHRAVIYGSGVTGEALKKAVEMAAEASDNAGLTRYAKIPVLASQSAANAMALNILDLASLPDGFDYQTDTTLGMYTIALAGGFPPRWLWPATAVGATKADAMLQHTAMSLSGASSTLTVIRNIIGGSERGRQHSTGKFLPPHLKFVFDFQDDEQDAQQAGIRKIRSDRHQVDVLSGLVNTRVAREQMLTDGDLTEQQFEDLELSDDRTADGEPVSVLFYRDYPLLEGFNLEEPDVDLLRQRLEEAYKALPAAVAHDRRRQVRESIGAMRWLARRIGLEDEPPLREREEETDENGEPLQEGEVEGSESTPETSRVGVPETQRGQRNSRQGNDAEGLKERKTVRPRGKPLPEWTAKLARITPQDIAEAIREWDERVPEAAGLLLAVPDNETEEQENVG